MKLLLGLAFSLAFTICSAQEDEEYATWNYTTSTGNDNNEIEVVFTATIDQGWQLYSSDFKVDIGPLPTEFEFVDNGTFKLLGTIQPIAPKKKVDRTWDVEYTYFNEKAEFRQRVKVLKKNYVVEGKISGQLCSESNGLCVPFSKTFAIR